jgi:hypothetical protein
MAKPGNTKIMIYVAHTESRTVSRTISVRQPNEAGSLTSACGQLKSCMDLHPLAQAWSKNRSLAFGASVVRKTQSSTHLCPAGEAVTNVVNRLWYGRALVSLRTYPQWVSRTTVVQQRLQITSPDEAELCGSTWANPIQ